MPLLRKLFLVLLAIVIAITLTAFFVPWKPALEKNLADALEKQGFQNVRFTLDSVGLTGLTLKDITLGTSPPLTLRHVTINYALPELLLGRAQDITLGSLTLEMHKEKDGWTIPGYAPEPNAAPFAFPTTRNEISAFPLTSLNIEKSLARFIAPEWQLDLPLELGWQTGPSPTLKASSQYPTLKIQNTTLAASEGSMKATLNDAGKKWQGEWRMNNVAIMGENPPLPAMNAEGTLMAQANTLRIKGQMESLDHAYKTAFHAVLNFKSPETSKMVIDEADMPWNEGALKTDQITIPLGNDRPIDITLKIKNVAANALLQKLTGEKATATGAISGELPLTINADGAIILRKGAMKADGPGTITMAPEAIPGDNEQVAFVREVMKDFRYSLLTLETESDKDNHLTVLMTVEGNNPKVSEGRAVKVNVRLHGDVLNFVQQNVLGLINPQKYLEQGNAKP